MQTENGQEDAVVYYFKEHRAARAASWYPGAERVDVTHVRYIAKDVMDMMIAKMFMTEIWTKKVDEKKRQDRYFDRLASFWYEGKRVIYIFGLHDSKNLSKILYVQRSGLLILSRMKWIKTRFNRIKYD